MPIPAPMPLDPSVPLVGGTQSATVAALDAAIERQIASQGQRGYLGMSQIGKTDKRTLWLQFRGCLPNEHAPRAERIFRLGDAIEVELARYLRMIPGVELHTADENGRQFAFEHYGGHFAGRMDGVIRGVPEAPKTWHLWEAKSVSAKRFAALDQQGVERWSPEYYAQLQCYMGAAGLERALFCAYCKDDSRIYTERVRFDPAAWDALQVRALDLIEAKEPPASSFKDRSWYEAKWMPPITSAIYWRERLPPKTHCKNCRFSSPILTEPGANWGCALADGETIPGDVVLDGCQAHQWIPALFPGEPVSVDASGCTYRLPDGLEITNGLKDWDSQELAEASKEGFAIARDPFAMALRNDMRAKLVRIPEPATSIDDDIPF